MKNTIRTATTISRTSPQKPPPFFATSLALT
jgi:hypothetical protein